LVEFGVLPVLSPEAKYRFPLESKSIAPPRWQQE